MIESHSVETFDMNDSSKKDGLSWFKVKIALVVFIILLIIVGLMSGLLAAKNAREEVEEKYALQKGKAFMVIMPRNYKGTMLLRIRVSYFNTLNYITYILKSFLIHIVFTNSF